jgi:hypothetical protein
MPLPLPLPLPRAWPFLCAALCAALLVALLASYRLSPTEPPTEGFATLATTLSRFVERANTTPDEPGLIPAKASCPELAADASPRALETAARTCMDLGSKVAPYLRRASQNMEETLSE